ncbi:lysophospholipid acyltransferase family protein [Gordonia humi]|uniref:1-acyl-sn-glycerol-3-phosphate acyltransferase n=1 Tax=Gordonia humi TaxID=686429 RepID=A0A840EZY2_9ACTN|nr:lysophospholipid acyltransferase family protein [Gordonia humi]MBB4137171.1 1-acyl-sn-glycerol-3-phosphate acyltransferase [Gordonia humi]
MATNPWVPVSPCGAHCVPDTPRVSRLRVWTRLAAFGTFAVLVLALGVATMAMPRRARHRYWRRSARIALASMGVRLTIEDRRPETARRLRGALIVANHISFLDIVAVASVAPARFIAKREVLQMAGFGYVAKLFGVLSHVRGDLGRLRPLVDRVAGILDRGRSVAVFPEGTTWCGGAAGRFRPAFFQAAVDAGAPIVPMRLSYSESGRPTTLAGFIGDDTIGTTFSRIVSARELTVEVTVFDLVLPVPDRRHLADVCEEQIVGVPAPHQVALKPAPSASAEPVLDNAVDRGQDPWTLQNDRADSTPSNV